MTPREVINLLQYYAQSNHRKKTIENYAYILSKFDAEYAERLLDSVCSDEIYRFLQNITQNLCKSPRRLRYDQLNAFYNFIIDRCSLNIKKPMQYNASQ